MRAGGEGGSETVLTSQYPVVLWFRIDAGEEVEFIVWRRVLAPEKEILFKF